ncbi:MAG: hypothetical protein ACLRZH_00470 [Ruthenibacterium lactatiformans]
MVTYFKDVGILGPRPDDRYGHLGRNAGRRCASHLFSGKKQLPHPSLMSACCVGTYILLLVAKTPASALICLFLFGLAIAGVNRRLSRRECALRRGPRRDASAAGVGAVLMPYITGAVAQRFGIWAGMLCTVFALMGMTACAVALHRRNDMK